MPDTLYSPEREEVTQGEPPVIVVSVTNRQQAAFCRDLAIKDADGNIKAQPYGDASIVPDGALTSTFALDDKIVLTDSVLRYVATSGVIASLQGMFHADPSLPAEEVAELTKMPISAAEKLLSQMREAQQNLDATAATIAEVGLVCLWYNEMQKATCPLDANGQAPATPIQNPEAVPEAIVPASAVFSPTSLEEANANALAMAQTLLRCFFVSEAVVVDCRDEDRPGYPSEGGTEEVPNGVVGYQGRPPQRGTIVVPEGAITSTISVREATESARMLGWSQLSCYYISSPVYKQCGLSSARARGVSPKDTNPVEAIPSESTGQYVALDEGAVISEISSADATETANEIALTALECCFLSDPVSRSCDTIYYQTGSGDEIPVKPKDTPGYVSSVRLEEGAVIMCVEDYALQNGETYAPDSVEQNTATKERIDEDAKTLAETSLNCLYCNVQVLPKCVPNWVIKAATKGVWNWAGELMKIDLPLDIENLRDPYTGELVDTSSWATDFTLGTAADTYCSDRFWDAQDVADFGGVIKPTHEDTCQFANDLMIVACEGVDTFNSGLPVTPGTWEHRKKTTGEYYWIYISKEEGTGLAAGITPAIGSTMEVAEGTFIYTFSQVPGTVSRYSTAAGQEVENPDYNYDYNARLAKEYANKMAQEAAIALLDCFYENHETTSSCTAEPKDYMDVTGDKNDPKLKDAPRWETGLSKSGTQLTDDSTNALSPAVVPAGTFRSYESLLETYYEAKNLAESLTMCHYWNEKAIGSCSTSGTKVNNAVVQARTIVANSPEEANASAKALANAMAACVDSSSYQMFCNNAVTGTCSASGGKKLISQCTVPAGSICSTESQAAADAAAKAIADAATICLDPDDFMGAAGRTGANGSCGGTCYGVYV